MSRCRWGRRKMPQRTADNLKYELIMAGFLSGTLHSHLPTKSDGSSFQIWGKAARSTSWEREGSKSLHWNMFISTVTVFGFSFIVFLFYFERCILTLHAVLLPVLIVLISITCTWVSPVYLIHVFPLLSAVAAVTFVFGYFLHVLFVLGSASFRSFCFRISFPSKPFGPFVFTVIYVGV